MKKCKMRWKKDHGWWKPGWSLWWQRVLLVAGAGEGVEHNNQPGNLGMGTGNLGKPGLTEAIFCIALLCLQIQTFFFGSLGLCSPFLGHLVIHLNKAGDCKWSLEHWRWQFILTAMKIHIIMTLLFFSDSVSPIQSWHLQKKLKTLSSLGHIMTQRTSSTGFVFLPFTLVWFF